MEDLHSIKLVLTYLAPRVSHFSLASQSMWVNIHMVHNVNNYLKMAHTLDMDSILFVLFSPQSEDRGSIRLLWFQELTTNFPNV